MERKADALLRKSWEASMYNIKTNIAATSVARSMYLWLGDLENHLSNKTSREEILQSIPLLKSATGFLADASAESIRFCAKEAGLFNAARRALWMKSWSGDRISKQKLVSIPFSGEYVFGPVLDKILEKAADRKKGFPEERSYRRNQSFQSYGGQNKAGRGKGKSSHWAYPKGVKEEVSFLSPNLNLKTNNDSIVGGGGGGRRVKDFLGPWALISKNPCALDIIRQGCKIEFTSLPPPGFVVTKMPARSSNLNIFQGVQDLVKKGAVIPVPTSQRGQGYYSTLFLVKKKEGDFRTIINLKQLNKFILYRKFKMESLKSIVPLIKLGAFMCSFDLKDSYLHVPRSPEIPKVCDPRPFQSDFPFSIHSATLRDLSRTKAVNQTGDKNDSSTQTRRVKYSAVPGRFFNYSRLKGAPTVRFGNIFIPSVTARMDCEPTQVC
ncbi:uncharacterized protein LOC122945122 isoform X1 [Bufo gargarizans]|uniref:uncharacterized protein LOC122945122 isoform X1 n=1 Tax=Bufo gargarizans TaxID=30331 RepID=UPI001CF39585|nr:uncharacterized protein LOC122945122 isoform X1 [Bufo gargarizans]